MDSVNKKVVVAISGGLDSGAAAFILKKQGHDLIGVYFRIGVNDRIGEEAARKVCRFLDIPFFPVNLSCKFKKEVIDYFIDNYSRGLTPNPCVKCNKLIKFGELFTIARELGADFMATGHYIRKGINKKNKITLLKSNDLLKDQSYFLYNLNQEILKNVLFPCGEYTKEKIREIAEQENIPFLKSESQDICFLNEDGKIIDHNDFLRKNIKSKKGLIKTLNNKEIGEHQGLHLYTIGQRKGIELGGTGPFYAFKKDYENNILYVVNNLNDPALFDEDFIITNVNWISDSVPKLPFDCEVAIRYRHKPTSCTVDFLKGSFDLSKEGRKYTVNLHEAQRAISPGQSAVFYKGDELLGGGVIVDSR